MSRVRAGRNRARGAQREAVSREDEEEERAQRERARTEREASYAARWLFDAVPDDPELREHVYAAGALLFLQRQINRCEREAEARLAEFVTTRGALVAVRDELKAWKALEPAALLHLERARYEHGAAKFRRENEFADDMDVRRDHDAHVWAWMNR